MNRSTFAIALLQYFSDGLQAVPITKDSISDYVQPSEEADFSGFIFNGPIKGDVNITQNFQECCESESNCENSSDDASSNHSNPDSHHTDDPDTTDTDNSNEPPQEPGVCLHPHRACYHEVSECWDTICDHFCAQTGGEYQLQTDGPSPYEKCVWGPEPEDPFKNCLYYNDQMCRIDPGNLTGVELEQHRQKYCQPFCDTKCAPHNGVLIYDQFGHLNCSWEENEDQLARCNHIQEHCWTMADTGNEQCIETCDTECKPSGGIWKTEMINGNKSEYCWYSNIPGM